MQTSKRFFGAAFPAYKGLKITQITAYQVALPLHESSYKWAGGKEVVAFDATIVRIRTNDPQIEGFGENTPLGPAYLAAYAEGTRTGIRTLAPSLLGADPTRLHSINMIMDRALKGHPYVKSALDMACWDILGKVAGLPVCELLGGRTQDKVQLYRAISQDTPDGMARNVEKYIQMGYRKFQLKVGGGPAEDIDRIRAVRQMLDKYTESLRRSERNNLFMPLYCDANTGWKIHEAMQVVNGVKDLNVYIEQPCLTYEECLSVRQHCPLPFILDECMDDMGKPSFPFPPCEHAANPQCTVGHATQA